MTIEEAIELNQALEKDLRAKGMPSCAKSIRLGIEALKRIQASREYFSHVFPTPLPGETKE
jgi:hypothetical protein